jgi:hypothetical protein
MSLSSHAKPNWVPLAILRGANLNADHLMHLKVGYRWSFTLDFRVHGTMNCLLYPVRHSAPPHLQLSGHVRQRNDGFTPTPCEPKHDGIEVSN